MQHACRGKKEDHSFVIFCGGYLEGPLITMV